jgi:outer membrane protein insertion porin family/translocation and assembly module TamA
VRKDYPVGRDTVSAVDVQGASSVDADELTDRLATAASPRFLRIWDGVVYDYEVFDETLLARDLLRIERYYRARGYYQAKVTAARVVRVDAHRVRVEIRVREGQPTLVDHVSPSGLERVPIDVAADAIRAIRLRPDEPFDEALFEESKQRIKDVLGDSGYAFADVEAKAHVSIAARRADVVFAVKPGEVATFGTIQFVGLREIPEGPVRANFLIERGERFNQSALKDAQNALTALGVFSDVEVRTDRSDASGAHEVPITVLVRETLLRGVKLGIGATADVLRVATHLRAGWEDHNFLGGMRSFSIDTTPGVTLYPARIDHLVAPTRPLPENRLHTELRQPSLLEGRTTGIVAGDFNVVPLLYPVDKDPEAQMIIGYREYKGSLGAERAFFGHHLYLTQSFNFEARDPFAYQLPPGQAGLPAGVNLVTVIYPELVANLDFRDDPIQPHAGAFISNSLQVAVPVFDSSVSDLRIRPELRGYVPLSKRVTLALRSTFGFLIPNNYGSTRREGADPDDPASIEDQHKFLLRAFYSGGPDSNRGYPYQGIGRTGPIGMLVPTGVNCPRPPTAGVTLDPACTRPLGGLTLWEASMEVRFPIVGPLRGVAFGDASNVTQEVGALEFTPPHVSVGPGFRYLTPVGPVRLDIGWRVTPIGDDEGKPPTVFGLPMAIAIAIGEAF